MRERRNDLEIRNESPQIALQIPNSDRSPLYDVRYHARRYSSEQRVRSDVSRTIVEAFSNFDIIWWSQTGSNRRPHACKARALPAELWPRNQKTNAPRASRRNFVSPSSPFGLRRARFTFLLAWLRHAEPKAKRGGPGKT